ncbi:hypothetical protein D3C86_2178480 [compost metagenome]
MLNAFVTHLLEGDAREGLWKYHFSNCAITHLVLSPEGPAAACLVDASHLEALAGATAREELDSPAL